MIKENTSPIISLQLTTELYDYLKEKAKRECTSTSYLIRRMILEDMRKEENYGK